MQNGVIVLDKPLDKTSHDMVYFIRRLLGQKRVGHTGTLDPQASGVLPICVGMATKASEYMMCSGKEYIATIKLGIVTDTQDATGTILKETEVSVSKEEIDRTVQSFVGDIEQIPPMYSALKKDGQKLYDLARRGITVERNSRPVHIESITILSFDLEQNCFTTRIACSKGTYIRTLAHDIGEKLGCGAHMASLRRTKSGGFTLADAYTVEELLAAKEQGSLDKHILSIEEIYHDYLSITLDTKQTFKVRNGIPIVFDGQNHTHYRVYSADGEFLCVSTVQDGLLVMDTSFWCGG